jgi:hypothetical protein
VPRGQRDGSLWLYSRFSRQEPLLFYQVAPQLYSRGWVDPVHNHNTRQKLYLHVQFCRTNVFKNGVMNMGIRLYYKILNKIKEVGKMRQFKRVFRSYLVQHIFYSVAEYLLRLLVIGIWIVCLHIYDVSYVSSLTRKEE